MEQGGFSSVSSECHLTSLQPNKSKVGDSLQFFLGNNPSNQPANRVRHRSRKWGHGRTCCFTSLGVKGDAAL